MKTEIKASSHAELVRLTQQTLAEVGLDIPFERLDTHCGVSCDEFSVNYKRIDEVYNGKMYSWYEAYIFVVQETDEAEVEYLHELAQAKTQAEAHNIYVEYHVMLPNSEFVHDLYGLWCEADMDKVYAQLGQDTVDYFKELVAHNKLIWENEDKLSQLKWKITLGEYNGINMLQDLPKELWYLPLAWQEVYEICKAHDFYVEAYDQEVIKETFESPLCVLDLEEVMELTKNCWLYNTEIEMEFEEEEEEFEAEMKFYDCDDDDDEF